MPCMSDQMLPCTCCVWKINNPKLSRPAVEACNLFFLFFIFFFLGRSDRSIILHQFSSSLRSFLASIKNMSVQHVADVIPDSRSDTDDIWLHKRWAFQSIFLCVLQRGRSWMDHLEHNADPSASLSAASYHHWSSNGSRSSRKPFFLAWPAPYVNTSVSLILTRLLKDAPPAFWGLGAERRRLHRQLWGGEDCPDILSNCLSITLQRGASHD